MSHNDDEKLLPILKEWRRVNGEDFRLTDWIIAEGNVELAIGYVNLFYPDFVERDDCVFLAMQFYESDFGTWKSGARNRRDLESSINHIHVLDLFGTEEVKQSASIEQIEYLGARLKQIFEMKLKNDFPSRKFCVEFLIPDDAERIEYQLTFYQT